MRGLVQLAAEKLNSEISTIQFDDFAFSHLIDEALGFDKELRELYNYPTSEPSIIVILTQAQVLVKWLSMEKKCKELNFVTHLKRFILTQSVYSITLFLLGHFILPLLSQKIPQKSTFQLSKLIFRCHGKNGCYFIIQFHGCI